MAPPLLSHAAPSTTAWMRARRRPDAFRRSSTSAPTSASPIDRFPLGPDVQVPSGDLLRLQTHGPSLRCLWGGTSVTYLRDALVHSSASSPRRCRSRLWARCFPWVTRGCAPSPGLFAPLVCAGGMWGIWGCGGGLACAVREPIPEARRPTGVRSPSEVGNNERRRGFYWHSTVPHHINIIMPPAAIPPTT